MSFLIKKNIKLNLKPNKSFTLFVWIGAERDEKNVY